MPTYTFATGVPNIVPAVYAAGTTTPDLNDADTATDSSGVLSLTLDVGDYEAVWSWEGDTHHAAGEVANPAGVQSLGEVSTGGSSLPTPEAGDALKAVLVAQSEDGFELGYVQPSELITVTIRHDGDPDNPVTTLPVPPPGSSGYKRTFALPVVAIGAAGGAGVRIINSDSTTAAVADVNLILSSADGTVYMEQGATAVSLDADSVVDVDLTDAVVSAGSDLSYSATRIRTTAGGSYGATCIVSVYAPA